MSTRKPRREPVRRIESGEFLRFNEWADGLSLRGGFHFLAGLPFADLTRLIVLRHTPTGLRPRRNFRTIYFPYGQQLYLQDYLVDGVRGVVLELVSFAYGESGGPWVTDLVLAGQDASKQTWLHHVPSRLLHSGVEGCERWLFGMSKSDRMVREM